MKIMSPKFRIATGISGIIISLVMLAFYAGLIPDKETAMREGRTALAESIAIHSTAMVLDSRMGRLREDLTLMAERNEDLLTLALRRADGHPMVAIGDHVDQWQAMSGDYSKDSQVRVPIWSGKDLWGQLELRFTPIHTGGFLAVLESPMIKMVLFMGLLSLIVFYFYMGKVLRHLDPSRAIPGRVRAALDTMAEGLLILDRKEQIVLANQAFGAMFNTSPDKLMGQRAGEMPWTDTDGKNLKKSARPWVQALEKGEVQKNIMLRLQVGEDEWRTFNINCSPVLGDAGKYAGVLVSLDDITELEKKEVELIKSREEAVSANQSKSEFLANMSHEIRTPMNAILGFTEILKRGYVKNEKDSLRYLNTIHSSGKSLLELINDILDLSKVESGRFEVEKTRTDPYRTIQEVLQMMNVKAQEKGLMLGFSAKSEVPGKIETDPTRLRQMIFNLVGNAIKFTDQGSVTVTCSFEGEPEGPRLLIDIIDTGIGMTKKALENIFNPFVQADSTVTRRFGGTGLGLAISRKFARALGGDITVTSEEGKGSTFRIVLGTGNLEGVPFLQPDQVAMLEDAADDHGAAGWEFSGGRILVVDDGAENRELVKLVLEEAGLTVEEAENGRVGVDKAAATSFDVILMDVQMPVMDGFTATGEMRARGMKTPIIALTANAMKGYEKKCLDAGYSDYISKPVNIDLLMDKMAKLLNGKSVTIDRRKKDAVCSPEDCTGEESSAENLPPIVSKLPSSNERFRKLIARFITRVHEQLEAMDQACDRGDLGELASLAHWLKGAGGTVGFDDFTEPARKLEMHAKEGRGQEAKQAINFLRGLASRLVIPVGESTAAPAAADPQSIEKVQPSAEPVSEGQTPVVSRLASNPRLKKTILSFVKKLDEQVAKIEQALEQKDMTELAGLAHWLKGSGGTVGYDAFTEPAAKLENFARTGQIEQAGQMLEQVKKLAKVIVPPVMDEGSEEQ